VKVETFHPDYILFNVYEINCCVIDWHNCVFCIGVERCAIGSRNAVFLSVLNIQY